MPDAAGVAAITVTVNDGGSSNNITVRTFTVTVNAVNDPPTLDPIGDLSIPEDSGLQTVAFSGITSGASNENQVLSITVSASDPAPAAGGDNAVNRRQLLGLRDLPRKYTVEKWVGNEVKIIEMSNDRIKESRDVTSGRRGIPVSQPAPANNDVSLDDATGVKSPEVAVAAGEEALLAVAPAAPESK